MADFVPTTAIYFFKGTRVSLQNQPFFTSESAKLGWYAGHDTKVFTNYSYQRENRQYVRVNAPCEEMRGYDMMAFRNGTAGKTIFCRVIEVEFVNPNTTQVTFETDSMQTFIEDISFNESWVEREMQKDDWNGSLPSFNNLMPEGLESGATKKALLEDTFSQIMESGSVLVVLSAYDTAAEPNYSIKKEGGFYYGLNKLVIEPGSLESMLKAYADKGRLDGIAGIWCVPRVFAGESGWAFNVNVPCPTSIDGYTPKNAKCFTGEFCTIELSNRMGQSVQLLPEYLYEDKTIAEFGVDGYFAAGSGGAVIKPNRYCKNNINVSDFGVFAPMNAQTCYISDAFANWASQNTAGLALEGITTAVQAGVGVATLGASVVTGNVIAGAVAAKQTGNALYSAANTMANVYDKSRDSASTKGASNSTGYAMASGRWGFSIYYDTPPAAVIESIDNFFDVFGYRTCCAKKPNVDTRPFWNYVKCSPSSVSGPFTSRDKQNIEAVLNSGVTFWHVTKGAVIGDYSKDNRG